MNYYYVTSSGPFGKIREDSFSETSKNYISHTDNDVFLKRNSRRDYDYDCDYDDNDCNSDDSDYNHEHYFRDFTKVRNDLITSHKKNIEVLTKDINLLTEQIDILNKSDTYEQYCDSVYLQKVKS